MARTVVLIILDGWGIGRNDETNPIYMAKPANFKFLEENYPYTSLQASGISVGLPWGETGNSEVGHLTIGAGKVIYQYFPRITMAIRDGTFFENPALKAAAEHARNNNSYLNFAGLLTKANVHASLDHIKALLEFAEKEGIEKIRLHLFADGKDSPPKTFEKFLAELPQDKIASLIGRYYGMDREANWRLTEQAYNCMTGTFGTQVNGNLKELVADNYAQGLNEGFLPPLRLQADGGIKDGDALFFFNYREDSIRQIADSFLAEDFDKFKTKEFKNLFVATMTHYMDKFTCPVAFPPEEIEKPLGKVISDAGLSQLRIAESYKYAHITYFFNNLIEPPFEGEYRVLIPSEPIPHPDEHPQMMAAQITDRLLQAMENSSFNFILVNYANGDSIAHTGNYHASEEAVKTVDKEIGRVIEATLATDAVLFISSDHGNVEELTSPMTGEAETQHDPNPVPLYLVGKEFKGRKFINWQSVATKPIGIISDIAPTILEVMGLQKPEDMTGRSLMKDLL
ncbi:MAG: 2,3-bisphosphoglycerate-independent phosphoglycerate mutase [Candidatus Liptonbacteria bacterium]|nr:2,3-bisphosphoglycerate-independent phosphoglycerate mutase [Candidatus Liptonbacteria bacterium]